MGFLPSLISTGWNPPRTVAPVFLVYIIGYFGFIIYYHNILDLYVKTFKPVNSKPIVILFFILIIALSSNNNVMNAYKDISSGKAFKYNQEVTRVYEQLNHAESDTIFVYPLKYRPLVLPIRWPDHYNRLVNDEWQMYFMHQVEMAKPN